MPADDAVAGTVRGLGRVFEARAVDLAGRDAVIALGTPLAGRAPDILINNAGTIKRAPAAEHPLSWRDGSSRSTC